MKFDGKVMKVSIFLFFNDISHYLTLGRGKGGDIGRGLGGGDLRKITLK
jgi:hypothetical protein